MNNPLVNPVFSQLRNATKNKETINMEFVAYALITS